MSVSEIKNSMTEKKYQSMYQQSINDPENFWAEQAQQFITWSKSWDKVLVGGFEKLDVQWFQGATLNAAYNCLDRHLATRAHQAAIIWEGDDASQKRVLTYQDLFEQVCQFANVLKAHGIKKGDRVCIYLPMIPEAAIVMLACVRIGAIHSVVFAGFSAESLKSRILDADCCLVITANESVRAGKTIALKKNVDMALQACPNVSTVIVVQRTENKIDWNTDRDVWYHEQMAQASLHCDIEEMNASDPIFILYTSGSTGKPKGVLHVTGGYLVYVATTFKYIFDYRDGEIYWCTADVGWITGHSYCVYGPLLNGATTLMFEGVPNFPTPSRYWEMVDRYNVNIFYTAPTAIRALRREGDEWVTQTSRKSLRLLGSVGEPINPEAWKWYYNIIGMSKCPIADTWWQTETGGIMISPIQGVGELKPGCAATPFFGVLPEVVDDNGNRLPDNKMGNLLITKPWPGMMQTIYRDHKRYQETYFSMFPGKYLTSDQAYRDADGYFWIGGRNDDVIKVSGHRIGTEEVESALLTHASVSEAAVVAISDAIKGQSIYAFVSLKKDVQPSDNLKKELVNAVRTSIGPIATPDHIQWTDAMPKTRSGKILRRLLRKIANNETEDLGDVSALADPQVLDVLIQERHVVK